LDTCAGGKGSNPTLSSGPGANVLWQMLEENRFFSLELRVDESGGASSSSASSSSAMKFRIVTNLDMGLTVATADDAETIFAHWRFLKEGLVPQLHELHELIGGVDELRDFVLINVAAFAKRDEADAQNQTATATATTATPVDDTWWNKEDAASLFEDDSAFGTFGEFDPAASSAASSMTSSNVTAAPTETTVTNADEDGGHTGNTNKITQLDDQRDGIDAPFDSFADDLNRPTGLTLQGKQLPPLPRMAAPVPPDRQAGVITFPAESPPDPLSSTANDSEPSTGSGGASSSESHYQQSHDGLMEQPDGITTTVAFMVASTLGDSTSLRTTSNDRPKRSVVEVFGARNLDRKLPQF